MSIRKKVVWLPYDMDTAIGINNEGALAFSYNLEDTDQTSGGADVYNGQDSVMWCNLRDAFGSELTAMYKSLRSAGVLSYSTIEQMFELHQGKWPEAIFNEDAFFKYLQPLIDDNDGAYLSMLQGSKAEQRKWWLYNRFRYLDSKYNAGDALTDVITLRGYAKDNITVTPYADIYPCIKYGSYLVQTRGERGNSYTLVCPLDQVNDTEIYIYSASQLASVGDISGLKVGYANFANGTKLQDIKIGDADPTYSNGNLTELYLGNNTLLQTLDVRNCPNLLQTVDLKGCTTIEEVYFDGTSIAGVELPNGGVLNTLHLPGTITNLTIRNQPNLADLTVDDYSNVSTLWLEGVPDIDSKAIVCDISDNARARLLGIDWEMEDEAEFKSVFDKVNTFRGLDEQGQTVSVAQLTGEVYTPRAYRSQLRILTSKYPYIEFNVDDVTSLAKDFLENKLTFLEDDEITSLGGYVFQYSSELTEIRLPNCVSIGAECFHSCTGLKKLIMPRLKTMPNNGNFYDCNKLEYIAFPLLESSLGAFFNRCRSAKWADVGITPSITGNAFEQCNALTKIFLRNSDAVVSLSNVSAFTGSPFRGNNNLIGKAYVPSSLISSYQSAANWTTLYNNGTCIFKPLEDFTEDGTVTGELDWDALSIEDGLNG